MQEGKISQGLTGMAPKAAVGTLPPKQSAQQLQTDTDHELIVDQACRKLNRLMLPFALLFSIIASLDRANLSFASLCMSRELGFTPMDYGLGSAIFFISYSLFQIPSNVTFIYLGGPHMLGLIAISWGLVAGSMAAVSSSSGFLAVRFLLGVAEAGTVPGIWAYLSSMYPSSHLTLPTTFYMAGITLAQALGAPLAAGLLNLHGTANLSGWRWLFIIEGAPAVLLGIVIWLFLPAKVSACRLLSPEEQRHLQAAIDGTIPPSCATSATPRPSVTAVPASDLASCSSRSSSSDGSIASTASSSSSYSRSLAAVTSAATMVGGRRSGEQLVAAGLRHNRADGKPTMQQLWSDMRAASRCRVVWCSSLWRFLYLLTLNGLIFWVPLIVHSLLEVPAAVSSEVHHGGEGGAPIKGEGTDDTRILLLAAVPYVAGVVTHVVNALHSHHVHERRYHIAVPWLLGALLLLVLPVAWQHQADEFSYALLVLASMGIMGCDGIDVSWIISLMDGLTPSESALAMAMINMLGNVGGFVGNFVIGALKQATGNYFGAVWMMGAIMLVASGLVVAFPTSWATQRPNNGADKSARARRGEECTMATEVDVGDAKSAKDCVL